MSLGDKKRVTKLLHTLYHSTTAKQYFHKHRQLLLCRHY